MRSRRQLIGTFAKSLSSAERKHAMRHLCPAPATTAARGLTVNVASPDGTSLSVVVNADAVVKAVKNAVGAILHGGAHNQNWCEIYRAGSENPLPDSLKLGSLEKAPLAGGEGATAAVLTLFFIPVHYDLQWAPFSLGKGANIVLRSPLVARQGSSGSGHSVRLKDPLPHCGQVYWELVFCVPTLPAGAPLTGRHSCLAGVVDGSDPARRETQLLFGSTLNEPNLLLGAGGGGRWYGLNSQDGRVTCGSAGGGGGRGGVGTGAAGAASPAAGHTATERSGGHGPALLFITLCAS